MKYSRLTKEQFEELHQEFINFLSTQAIDKNEWDKIKIEKPENTESRNGEVGIRKILAPL